ncbi:unnamed protein product [Mytilus coruscus]|uniref:Uncharacterized protein n=1 Tax=Mytilus coruscus TaxID=42192 RepID=A0A6J8DHC8_MYTCO|nr:unnamed protein product [Mytilus coruscus]
MLRQTHGEKAVKSWDNHRQLYSQPLKQIEKLGFHGQLSARMNIISVLYMQQALGSLLQTLESDDFEKDEVCQTIKDVFAMSTKTLDQAGRTGAFLHLVRRQAASQDLGLTGLKDMSSKCQYLPLTNDGVFGKELEIALEKRKEQKEQLSDLLPEFKRKFENNAREKGNNMVSRYSSVSGGQNIKNNNNVKTNSNATSTFPNYRKPAQNFQKDKTASAPRQSGQDANKTSFKSGKSATQSSWGSFRIPKRKDS